MSDKKDSSAIEEHLCLQLSDDVRVFTCTEIDNFPSTEFLNYGYSLKKGYPNEFEAISVDDQIMFVSKPQVFIDSSKGRTEEMMILSEEGISFLFTSNPYEQKQLSNVRFTPNHFESYLKVQKAGRYGVSDRKYLSFGLNSETLIASLSQPNQDSEIVVYDQAVTTLNNDILSFLRLLSEKKDRAYVSMYKRKVEKAVSK
jgi:hypothetical protein